MDVTPHSYPDNGGGGGGGRMPPNADAYPRKNNAWQQPDVPANANCDIQLQNVAPDDGLKSPKHVEHLMINKDSL
jgi:hypothetical protein